LADPARYGLDMLTLAYVGVFGSYWLWSCGATWFSLREAWEIGRFYELELEISSRELRTLRWNEVVLQLGDLQKRGRAPWKAFQTAGGAAGRSLNFGDIEMLPHGSTPGTGSLNKSTMITAHDIACRIMRKENYLIVSHGATESHTSNLMINLR